MDRIAGGGVQPPFVVGPSVITGKRHGLLGRVSW
jgi:hypothetical protein